MLCKRLRTAANLIDKCGTIVDVGCDHGFISRFVLDNKLADNVIASDISLPSLNKAKKLLSGYENISFKVGDGFSVIEVPFDLAVICGMGGETIIEILSGYQGGATLILQPQNHIPKVRRFLNSIDYEIVSDICVCDRGKYYDCIKAKRGCQQLLDNQYEWGVFCNEKNLTLLNKLSYWEKKLIGYPKTEENLQKIKILTEVKKCQL